MSALPTTLKGNVNLPDLPATVRKAKSAKLPGLSPNLSASLMMSDYWFLAGLILALFYVADPFFWRLDKIGPTKHLPLIISLCGVLLANVGNQVFHPRKSPLKHSWQILNAGLPLILLGIWIVVGSLYTRKFNDIQNTFITVGLYMLFTFLAARVVMISPARANIVRIYLLAAATLGIFMVIRMATNYDGMSVNYHELEALIIPLAVYFALRPSGLKNNDKRYTQVLFTLFFLAAGFAFRKNTGFLVLLLTLFYIWIAEWRFRFRENIAFRFWTMLWVLIVLISAVVAAGYFAQKQELLPSGNPEYRMLTYDIAWNKFTSSPIWGTGFSGQATEKFTAYTISSAQGNLATHSDILDLAAQGGIIALCLWLWGYLRVARISLRHALKGLRPRDDIRAAAHSLACMSLASIVVYAFNPILLQPAKSFLMWSQFGMLLGIALHLRNHHAEEADTKSAEVNAKNINLPTVDTRHA
jgi:O-antigen ligase